MLSDLNSEFEAHVNPAKLRPMGSWYPSYLGTEMNSLTEEDSKKCWDLLAYVLTFGRTCSFVYSKEPQEYILSHGIGSGLGYVDYSSEEYLLDDIQFALFNEKRPYIQLQLKGRESGPVFDVWYFIFTKEGLVKAESYYSTD